MGQGEEVQTQEGMAPVDILEGGDIFFFYRPRVNETDPKSVDDIQRFFLVLHPVAAKNETEIKQLSENAKKEGKVTGPAADPMADLPGYDEKSEAKNETNNVKPKEEKDGSYGGKTEVKESEAKQSESKENQNGNESEAKPASVKEENENGAKPTEVKEEEKKENEKIEGQEAETVRIGRDDLWRIAVVGRKQLPDPSSRTRPYWGYVELVTKTIEDVKKAISGDEYETQTRGQRFQPGSRCVGEGVYRILKHSSGSRMNTHLIYRLEYPEVQKQREPQDAFNIEREASYVFQIKNPGATTSQVGLDKKRRAAFPASLQGTIGSRRFVACDPPDFLNYEGCEFLLISASDDLEEELGIQLKGEDHRGCSDFEKLFGESIAKGDRGKPLFEGTWA